MTPVEVTSIAAVIVTAMSTVLVPLVMGKRAYNREKISGEVVSWQGITDVLQKERDALREELRNVDAVYRARIQTLETDYVTQLSAAKLRISQLETEVSELYRRLYQQPQQQP